MTQTQDQQVSVIEQALTGGLTHPGTGNGPIALPMPMFNNSAIPEEIRDQFAQDAGLPPHSNIARLAAEAIVHALQANGSALAEDIKTRTAAADVQPVAPPTPAPQPKLDASGNTIVTVDGQVLMTDLGDWQRKPPEIIATALRPGAQPPAWTKALLMALGDAAVASRPQRIDITTSDSGWTMSVSSAEEQC